MSIMCVFVPSFIVMVLPFTDLHNALLAALFIEIFFLSKASAASVILSLLHISAFFKTCTIYLSLYVLIALRDSYNTFKYDSS